MSSASSASATAGAAQLDAYRLVRPLGRGDGDVLLAHDRTLDRAVVLRFIGHDGPAARALLEGARALARVSHPSLSPVHRIRETGERPCVVQSFERGERLDVLLDEKGGSLPDGQVLDLGRALAGALVALHAAGVAHGEVRADRIVVSSAGVPRLFGLHGARAAATAEARGRDVADLVALLQRMASAGLRDPLARLAGGNPPAADDLLRALDALARPSVPAAPLAAAPAPNPYPGLRPFDAEHAALFFGRQREVDEALGRLRSEPWLLVAGPSGAGKSSLVRAGIAPVIAAGALGERARWDVVTLVPGAHPLAALADALAPFRERGGAGLLLVVDQLEEAIALADAAERDAFFAALAAFGALVPGVRAIATLRSDFLDRLSALGTTGRDLLRAAFVLPPMGAEGLRQAIVGPARARGFEMETPAMVDALATEAAMSAGGNGLPLLAFVLAELWNERDGQRRVLPEAALARLGGAASALARHSETVLASLTADERAEARRMLLALVTAAGEPGESRARRAREALIGEGGASAAAALEALVRGRLVVAGETYTIAHEALAGAWPRLRGWLDQASDARATRARLAAAAGDWVRLGRRPESLWSGRQLRDLEVAGALDGASDAARAFVQASRAATRRAQVRRWGLRAGAPVGALILTLAIALGIRWSERRETRAFVAARLAEAEPLTGRVADLDAQVEAARAEAFARFDADDAPGGEARWRDALSLARAESDAYAAASAPLGLALARDPASPLARARLADLALRWLLAAERDHEPDVARDLAVRLAQLDDDGSRRARLAAPARLDVSTVPPGARVVLHGVRVDDRGYRVEDEGRVIEPGTAFDLAPGSYVLAATARDRYSTRYPILLGRGQEERVEVPLPSAAAVPPGFVYVPAGRSLLGAADADGVRVAFGAAPEHPVYLDAYLIGAHEVTYAEYLDFLATLPASERTARRPHASGTELTFDRAGIPTLTLSERTMRPGEPMCPLHGKGRCRDWLRFPVAGVSWEDAQAYAAWLATGRAPGARLCAAREWERAARGADGRLYAHGDVLHPGDANVRFDSAAGADDHPWMGEEEVGSFPIDTSPFGVMDLSGNVGEWVGSKGGRETRGGDWSFDNEGVNARAVFPTIHQGDRWEVDGVRVCAAAPRP